MGKQSHDEHCWNLQHRDKDLASIGDGDEWSRHHKLVPELCNRQWSAGLLSRCRHLYEPSYARDQPRKWWKCDVQDSWTADRGWKQIEASAKVRLEPRPQVGRSRISSDSCLGRSLRKVVEPIRRHDTTRWGFHRRHGLRGNVRKGVQDYFEKYSDSWWRDDSKRVLLDPTYEQVRAELCFWSNLEFRCLDIQLRALRAGVLTQQQDPSHPSIGQRHWWLYHLGRFQAWLRHYGHLVQQWPPWAHHMGAFYEKWKMKKRKKEGQV